MAKTVFSQTLNLLDVVNRGRHLHSMTEAEVASIKTMVQLSHIDAPLAGLHRSFDTTILHKKAMHISVQLTKPCKKSF